MAMPVIPEARGMFDSFEQGSRVFFEQHPGANIVALIVLLVVFTLVFGHPRARPL